MFHTLFTNRREHLDLGSNLTAPTIFTTVEAASRSFSLSLLIQTAGRRFSFWHLVYPMRWANPAKIEHYSRLKREDDKGDAYDLAELLRQWILPEALPATRPSTARTASRKPQAPRLSGPLHQGQPLASAYTRSRR